MLKKKRNNATSSKQRLTKPFQNSSSLESALRFTEVTVPKTGFPDRFRICLKYVDSYNLAGGVPSPNAQVMLANSLYDPDSTGTGHQPLNYDQVTAIYLKYLVISCRARITFINASTTPCKWVACWSETDISSRSVDVLSETKFASSGYLGPTSGGNQVHVYEREVPLTSLMGQRLLDPDSTMYANYNASPSDGAFLIIKCASVDGVSNCNVYAKVELWYHAIFKDRNEPSAS